MVECHVKQPRGWQCHPRNAALLDGRKTEWRSPIVQTFLGHSIGLWWMMSTTLCSCACVFQWTGLGRTSFAVIWRSGIKWRFLPLWDHTPNVHLSYGFRHSQMIYEQKTAAPPGIPWQTIQDQNTCQQANSLSEPCYKPVSQNGSWPKWFPPVTFPKLE